MSLTEYIVLFVLVTIMGAGIPGPGDAALIAAGCLAGEGKLNVGVVLVTALVAWMLGSVIGFWIGQRGGRPLLDHPGRLEKRRRKLLAKGDHAFGRHTFVASVTMPAFVSGIFRVRFALFILGALVAGVSWIGAVRGPVVLPGRGGRHAHRKRRDEGPDRGDRARRGGTEHPGGLVPLACGPAGDSAVVTGRGSTRGGLSRQALSRGAAAPRPASWSG